MKKIVVIALAALLVSSCVVGIIRTKRCVRYPLPIKKSV